MAHIFISFATKCMNKLNSVKMAKNIGMGLSESGNYVKKTLKVFKKPNRYIRLFL